MVVPRAEIRVPLEGHSGAGGGHPALGPQDGNSMQGSSAMTSCICKTSRDMDAEEVFLVPCFALLETTCCCT